MEKFVVSARKYRPQHFNTVIGQSHITTTLKNAIAQNQLAHAFLFCGPRGVGKTTCARILAKTINCENRTADNEACDTCNSCVSFNQGTSLNIHELDAASNNSVDDIRNLVDQVRFAPQAGQYKVYIIDEVHMLSQQAFNAFLKTLEEPPPYAIFILATTEKHKILPTILSRCQIFDFKRITPNDIVEHLSDICSKESVKAENAALHLIALKSEGCMRDALSMMDKIVSFTGGDLSYPQTLEHLNILDEDYFFRLLQILQSQQLPEALLLFEEINDKGFEGDIFLEGLSEFVRNILVCKDERSVSLLEVAEDFKDKYFQAAKTTSMGWILAALNILNEALQQYKQAKNRKLLVELTLIKLSYLQQAVELVNDEGLSKKKSLNRSGVVQFKTLSPRLHQPTKTENKKDVATASSTTPILPEQKEEKVVYVETPPPVKAEPRATPRAAQEVAAPATSTDTAVKGIPSISLKRIKSIALQNKEDRKEVKMLTNENLLDCWNQFIQKLKAESNLSLMYFETAEVYRTSDVQFIIRVSSNIQTSFINGEKAAFQEHILQYFNNRSIQYQFELVEKLLSEKEQTQHLTSKEQYRLLVQHYPLIEELKTRLKLQNGF